MLVKLSRSVRSLFAGFVYVMGYVICKAPVVVDTDLLGGDLEKKHTSFRTFFVAKL